MKHMKHQKEQFEKKEQPRSVRLSNADYSYPT